MASRTFPQIFVASLSISIIDHRRSQHNEGRRQLDAVDNSSSVFKLVRFSLKKINPKE